MDGNHKPILGVTDVLRLNLVTINLSNFDRVLTISQPQQTTKADILRRYTHVFADKLGTLEGAAHLSVDESVPPVCPAS